MKSFITIFSFLILILFFNGCGSNEPTPQSTKVQTFSYVDGKVLEIFGDKVIVQLNDKDVVLGNSYEAKLTNKIIKKSLLLIGMNTYISNEKAIISDIRNDQITFSINATKLKQNQKVKIYLPKKTIALMDFSVIGMKNNSISKIAMDDMTTQLVQSGQYIVIEREKLDTILDEHKLMDSGLLDDESASKLGKLVSADIILTGSFAKRGNYWNINLRLVDVQTGIILSAINDKINSKDLKMLRVKDSSQLRQNFESNQLTNGWKVVKKKTKLKHGFDNANGANGTQNSYKISYKLKNGKSTVKLHSQKPRDLSAFKGIKLFLKSSNNATVYISLVDKNFNDPNVNKWVYPLEISNKWKEYKIDFDYLAIANEHRRKNPGGDGVLDLDSITKVVIQVRGKSNTIGEWNTLWIDELSLY